MSNPISITPSGFFGNDKKNIVSIENFMFDWELKKLNNFIRKNNVWDMTETTYNDNGTVIYDSDYWSGRVITCDNLLKKNRGVVEIIQNMTSRLKVYVDEFFRVEALPTAPAMVRWLPGQAQSPHADKELHEGPDEGKPNEFPWYDLASLFYLNDDYEGGELYFPKQGVSFKPKAGAAYFFPGDKNYIHGVSEIKSGVRYTCPLFWTIEKHRTDK